MEFRATIKGVSALKMNKPVLDSKIPRIRTEDDLIADAKIRTYFDEDIGFYVPAQAIRLAIVGGGKKIKQGRAFFSTFLRAVLRIKEREIPLGITDFNGQVEFIKEIHNIQKQRISKCFVIFPAWELTFSGFLFEDADQGLIRKAIELAGIYEGLLESRPGKGFDFGRFELKKFEVI